MFIPSCSLLALLADANLLRSHKRHQAVLKSGSNVESGSNVASMRKLFETLGEPKAGESIDFEGKPISRKVAEAVKFCEKAVGDFCASKNYCSNEVKTLHKNKNFDTTKACTANARCLPKFKGMDAAKSLEEEIEAKYADKSEQAKRLEDRIFSILDWLTNSNSVRSNGKPVRFSDEDDQHEEELKKLEKLKELEKPKEKNKEDEKKSSGILRNKEAVESILDAYKKNFYAEDEDDLPAIEHLTKANVGMRKNEIPIFRGNEKIDAWTSSMLASCIYQKRQHPNKKGDWEMAFEGAAKIN